MLISHIPNEIYLMIFEHIYPSSEGLTEKEYKAVLTSSIPVCHLFRAICLPRRLYHLTIKASQPRHIDFLDAFGKYPFTLRYLPAHVQSLMLTRWIPSSSEDAWVYTTVFERYVHSLHHFRHLSILCLDRVHVSRALFDTAEYLHLLQDVTITNCTFGPFHDIDTPDEMDPPLTPWTRLVFCDNRGYTAYLDNLAILAASPSLTAFATTQWDVCHAILARPVHFQLYNLQTPSPSINAFAFLRDVLVRTPTVQTLVFPSAPDYHGLPAADVPRFNLPSDALPRLRTLQCPSFYVEEFLEGRPVESVNIAALTGVDASADPPRYLFDQDSTPKTDILAALKKSTVPIRVLGVVADVFTQGHSVDHLSQLETLTMYMWWDFDPDVSLTCCSASVEHECSSPNRFSNCSLWRATNLCTRPCAQ